MPNSVRDEGAIEALQTLLALAERGVDFRAEFDQLLDNDPVLFHLEIHDAGTFSTDNHIASVKPTEGLKAFVATMVARNNQFDAFGGRRIDDVDRDHGKSPR